MEKERSSRGGEPHPPELHARDHGHTPRPPDSDTSVARAGDVQGCETDDPVSGHRAVVSDSAFQDALQASKNRALDLLRKTPQEDLDRAMHRARGKDDEALIAVLDDDLLGMIRVLAGDDADEERRLIEGCKRSPYLRDWVRRPVGLSLSVPAPDFGRDSERPRESGRPSIPGTAEPANDAGGRDPTVS